MKTKQIQIKRKSQKGGFNASEVPNYYKSLKTLKSKKTLQYKRKNRTVKKSKNTKKSN